MRRSCCVRRDALVDPNLTERAFELEMGKTKPPSVDSCSYPNQRMKSSYRSNLHTLRRALKAARASIESSVDNTRNATIEPDEKSYSESMLRHARASPEASVVNTNPTNERDAMSITSNNEITEKGPQTRHTVVDTDTEFPGGSSDDGSDNDQWLESGGEQHATPSSTACIGPTEREKPNGPAATCIRMDSNHVLDSLWKKGKFRSVDTASTPLDLCMERLAQRETAPPKPASEVTNDSLCKNGKMGSRRLDRTLDHLPIEPRGKKKKVWLASLAITQKGREVDVLPVL